MQIIARSFAKYFWLMMISQILTVIPFGQKSFSHLMGKHGKKNPKHMNWIIHYISQALSG